LKWSYRINFHLLARCWASVGLRCCCSSECSPMRVRMHAPLPLQAGGLSKGKISPCRRVIGTSTLRSRALANNSRCTRHEECDTLGGVRRPRLCARQRHPPQPPQPPQLLQPPQPSRRRHLIRRMRCSVRRDHRSRAFWCSTEQHHGWRHARIKSARAVPPSDRRVLPIHLCLLAPLAHRQQPPALQQLPHAASVRPARAVPQWQAALRQRPLAQQAPAAAVAAALQRRRRPQPPASKAVQAR
jgi:hypothetical protein